MEARVGFVVMEIGGLGEMVVYLRRQVRMGSSCGAGVGGVVVVVVVMGREEGLEAVEVADEVLIVGWDVARSGIVSWFEKSAEWGEVGERTVLAISISAATLRARRSLFTRTRSGN
jgi:hypothetical protein